MRIWHLIEPASPDGSPGRLRLLSDVIAGQPDVAHEVVALGAPTDLGLRTLGALTAAPGAPWTGRGRLRRILRAADDRACGPDVLHAWSATAAELAAVAAPDRPRVATFTDAPSGRARGAVLQYVLRRHPLDVISTLGAATCPAVPANDRVALTPVVDPNAIDRDQRDRLREAWDADDGSFIVGVLGDRPDGIDARFAAEIQNRLGSTARDIRVVVAGRARHRADADRWLGWTAYAGELIESVVPDEPWRIAPALDAAVVVRDGAAPPVQPMLWAMAAGVPVLADADPPQAAIADGGRALLYEPGDANGACNHLLRLHDDRDRARSLGTAGREHVVRDHAVGVLCDELRPLYALLVGGRVMASAPNG